MMDLIKKALKPIGLPLHFIDRGKSSPPCIVYTYTSSPEKHSNNKVESTLYTVLLNLYFNGNFIGKEIEIKEAMKNAGFIEQATPTPIWENEANSYNVAMVFTYEKYHF